MNTFFPFIFFPFSFFLSSLYYYFFGCKCSSRVWIHKISLPRSNRNFFQVSFFFIGFHVRSISASILLVFMVCRIASCRRYFITHIKKKTKSNLWQRTSSLASFQFMNFYFSLECWNGYCVCTRASCNKLFWTRARANVRMQNQAKHLFRRMIASLSFSKMKKMSVCDFRLPKQRQRNNCR